MRKQYKVKKDGFTIIEVALVLAIGGLIFLMVFLVLPGVQSGQRDSERRNAVTEVVSQLASYKTNNRNNLPTDAQFSGFISSYMRSGGKEFKDPKTGTDYTAQATSTAGSATLELGYIQYKRGIKCSGENATASGTAREAAVRIKLESGGHFCQNVSS